MEVIGRQWEQERVEGFLDVLPGGPAALVLEGDSGIGKTTLWHGAVEVGRRRSYRLLICRASESESALSFVGLGDLLETVSTEVLQLLPDPQRVALELALLRSAGEVAPDRVSLARGALGVLRATAAEAPTVLAIDDVQWLDPPTADVLRFVAHRLTDERLGLLVSARTGGADSLELDHAFPVAGLDRVRLEPLSFEELEEVVRLHLGASFTRPSWRALHRISGGNPFFALQLAEALERRGGQAPGVELPIPETLADAMRDRLTALSPSARTALLPVAALAQPTLSLMQAGAAEVESIAEAVRAGVLQVESERVRFTHPLLASFVYADASEAARQAVHRRLAPLVADPEDHALHLARGTVEPAQSVAATLEANAAQAATRGHTEIAAELAERSAQLTPSERTDDRARRVRTAATFLYAAGDGQRSQALLEGLVEQLGPSQERARALTLLGTWVDPTSRSGPLLRQALAEAGEDLELRSHILSLLCREEGWRGRWGRASRHGREAVALAQRSGALPALARCLARLAWAELGPDSVPTIERAVELERSLAERLTPAESASFLRGTVLLAMDRIDEARRQFEDSYEQAVALGHMWRSIHLAWLAELELRAGNWESALAHALRTRELGQWGIGSAEAWGAGSIALVEAHLGNEDAAARAGEHASRLARANGFHIGLVRSETALGFLRLSTERAIPALDHLLPLLEGPEGATLWRAHATRTLSYAVEALVAAGQLERGESVADRLEEHARAMPVPSAIAAAARCRALISAQEGELQPARAAIADALSAHARLHEPFELARTHLVQGTIERRARQKAAARTALEQAEAIFARLGARLWLERAQRELARTGLTRSLDRELTPTELRVAALAAAGAQNKEIAGALFVSVKTVEANLSRIYAKLGIRSRVELAARLSNLGLRDSVRDAQR